MLYGIGSARAENGPTLGWFGVENWKIFNREWDRNNTHPLLKGHVNEWIKIYKRHENQMVFFGVG